MRVPLLADTRIVVAEPGEDDIVLRPPPQRDVLDGAALVAALFEPAGPRWG